MNRYDFQTSLRKVLIANKIPKALYALGEYLEGAVCLEQTSGGYVVYCGEKGEKADKKEHEKLRLACFDLISRVIESPEEVKRIQTEFVDTFLNDVVDAGVWSK